MCRFLLSLAAVLPLPVAALAQEDAGVKQTIAFVQKLQTNTGGFLSMAPQPNIRLAPNLRSTSSAVRALHYLGGKVPDHDACVKFVDNCFDPASGGFSDFAKGKPDVFSTAVGIMAVTELKMPIDKYHTAAIKYLSDNAKSFEEIRIAAAGLERLKAQSPKSKDWLKEVTKLQNKDGTFGKDAGLARDTGGAVVTLLRLGGDLSKRDDILRVLKEGQRPSGGYGKGDNELGADLETTYRVMRCFVMLKARPEREEGMRTYVAKCRNEDGGYSLTPGATSTVSGTYFAAIVLHWLNQK
ncbi:MAG: hypothetical protein L0Y72_08930 [Gemmataceae bacterium]|nr:hypothetical protein [Gemmataceae bacterium]MCI0739154.1 hypothetical protein [Gemmataceae bacterium]